MNLIIDIGNSFTKIFVFDQNKMIHNQQFKTISNKNLVEALRTYPAIEHVIIASVGENLNIEAQIARNQLKTIIYLSKNTPLSIVNNYKTPETLGKDRIAAMVGAYNIFPDQNVLAIDAGTTITFDFINETGEYIGGNISPGLSMRFNALHKFTARLPLLEASDEHAFMGENTNEAIIAGVQNGLLFEIDSYIDKFLEQYSDLKVILTGGDTFFFAPKLKNRIFAEPFLVAIGLNRILQDNVKRN